MTATTLMLISSVALFIGIAFCADVPPLGAITVGYGGQYSTLQAALADTSSDVYFVFPGTYTGHTVISRPNIKIYGQTSNTFSYDENTVTFTHRLPSSRAGSNDKSGTIRVHAPGVSLYNINIANTYGNAVSHSQAIALSVQATYFGGYGLKIQGAQDTLLSNQGYQFYSNCWIEGDVDFIFGRNASVWIRESVINTIGDGAITASGRSSDDPNWFVIDSSTIQGSGSTYLGRPWSDYARVVFQNSFLSSNVNPDGWSIWSRNSPNTDHITFAEYGNNGPGCVGERASFATQFQSPVSISTVLQDTSWIDGSYL